ncbi:UNVERIFIED_CONTAM: hypothetical protein HDU68_011914 [Siphonaria sp. JEL0065]|nr:hypothetical protein HDU68_011914 [Siphonaria sp. JEL0065]
MGVIAILFTFVAIVGGVIYATPRNIKRHVAVFVVRLTSSAPDASLPWKAKVLPHSPTLKTTAHNVWSLVGTLPPNGPKLQRRMTIAKLSNGRLVVHSPVCCHQTLLDQIKAIGNVEFIIIPNEMHRLDAAAWATEFPEAKVVCPKNSQQQVEKAVKVHQTCEEAFPEYSSTSNSATYNGISYVMPKGLYPDSGELVYLIKHENASTHSLIVCDLFFNIDPTTPDVDPALVTIGSACGFGCTAIGRFMFVKDKAVARKWAETELCDVATKLKVTHVSVAHGEDLVAKSDDSVAIVKAIRKAAATFEKAHD